MALSDGEDVETQLVASAREVGSLEDLSSKAPDTLGTYLISAITDAIIQGRLRPGDKLSAIRLAEMFQVSPIPVREALSALEATGHVRRISRRGFYVTEMSQDDIEDTYRWRRILEIEALRIGVPLLHEVDDAHLEATVKQMTVACRTKDHNQFARLNREFHFIPFYKIKSPRLTRFLCTLWDSSVRYHSVRLQTKGEMQAIQREHHMLLQALQKRDVEQVQLLTLAHNEATLKLMRQILPKSD